MTDADLLNATLVEREELTSELAVIRVRPDSGVPDFKPGQYATLGLPPDPETQLGQEQLKKKGLARFILRPYSIASSPLDKETIEFYLALVPDGAFTPLAWAMQEGDRIYMAPRCKGKFTLDDVPANRDFVAIATGTGLAPFMSMIKTYRETGRWRRFVVIHGTRFHQDLGYRAELEHLADNDPTITYIPTCSREPEPAAEGDWFGLRGRVNVAVEKHTFEQLAGIPLSAEHCHVFLCGNPAMIDEMTEKLVAEGFVPKDREHPDGNLHFEKYW
jgi:ferredoxin--NADP+ reductase